MNPSELSAQEQAHVRAVLRLMRVRCAGWAGVAKFSKLNPHSLRHVMAGAPVSAGLAFRVARLVGTSIDDLLAGRYPAPGTCPFCGHRAEVEP